MRGFADDAPFAANDAKDHDGGRELGGEDVVDAGNPLEGQN